MITFYLSIFRYSDMDSNKRLKIFLAPLIVEIWIWALSPVWIRAIIRWLAE